MKRIMLLVVLLDFAKIAFAQNAPFFTNESLQQYDDETKTARKEPAQAQSAPGSTVSIEKANDESEKKYYCSKTEELKKRIQAAKDEVERQKAKPKREAVVMRDGAIIQRLPGIAMAEAAVKAAEREFTDFEESATRKGIPPGWLRCQY